MVALRPLILLVVLAVSGCAVPPFATGRGSGTQSPPPSTRAPGQATKMASRARRSSSRKAEAEPRFTSWCVSPWTPIS